MASKWCERISSIHRMMEVDWVLEYWFACGVLVPFHDCWVDMSNSLAYMPGPETSRAKSLTGWTCTKSSRSMRSYLRLIVIQSSEVALVLLQMIYPYEEPMRWLCLASLHGPSILGFWSSNLNSGKVRAGLFRDNEFECLHGV